jgi:hypothetical protein
MTRKDCFAMSSKKSNLRQILRCISQQAQLAMNSGKEGSRFEKVVDRGIFLLARADWG